MKIRMLSREDIRGAISMCEAIDIVEEAFVQISSGQARVPVRTPINVEAHDGVLLFMPAYLSGSDALGMKVVSVFPNNVQSGRSTINALLVINDPATGEPRAVLEGSCLTALRTGAASGVATRWLARPDSETVALFGAGVQGRTQLEAVCEVRDVRRIWVYDTVREAAAALVEDLGSRGGRIPPEIRVAASPGEAVRDADIICTATTSHKPVVPDAVLKPGVHINGIGSFKPDMREIGGATVRRALIVVDSVDAAWAEAGDLIIPRERGLIRESDVYAELGEIAMGRKIGRKNREQITFFKSVGNAAQDISVADRVLRKADRENLGTVVEL